MKELKVLRSNLDKITKTQKRSYLIQTEKGETVHLRNCS